MIEWKEYKLSDIVDIIKDTYLPNDTDNYKYIGLEHIEQETLRLNGVGSSKDVASNKFKFKKNDVLLGKLRVYFRKVVKTGFEGICSTDIWVLRAKKDISQNFLFYFIANWDFINCADGGEGGTRMPRADWGFLKNTIWKIPPLSEQNAIAEVLSSLDDKIDLLHRQNRTLEQMAETIFRKWFIEDADEEWEERPLSSIGTFLNGLACQKYPPQNEFDKLPVLKIKELRNGFSEDCDWCTSKVDEKYIVENGDIIFSWSASLMVKIWNGEKCILNQHLFKITSKIFPKWFYYSWSKYHLDRFISISLAHATTMGHIKRGDLDNAIVIVPSVELLNRLNLLFEPLIAKIIENNRQINKLTTLRDALLPKLMSGEVTINI
jgi:type I restriction enzyme S subunit